jgi:hypothetical protein
MSLRQVSFGTDDDNAVTVLVLGAGGLGEIVVPVDGGGSPPAARVHRQTIETACVMTSASIVGDVSGSVVVTVKRDRGGTVTTLGTVSLAGTAAVRRTNLTGEGGAGWTANDLAAGDILILEGGNATTLGAYTTTLGRRPAQAES